jgi:hypothetical protein
MTAPFSSSRLELVAEYQRRAQEVDEAERDVLNKGTDAACAKSVHMRREFAAWLMAHHAQLFLSETRESGDCGTCGLPHQHSDSADQRDLCPGHDTSPSDKQDEAGKFVSITVGGSTHTRTAGEWLALARSSPSHVAQRDDPQPLPGMACKAIYDEAIAVAQREKPLGSSADWISTALVHVYAAGQCSITRSSNALFKDAKHGAVLNEDGSVTPARLVTESASGAVEALRECRAYFERELADDQTLIDGDFGTAYRLTVAALAAAERKVIPE